MNPYPHYQYIQPRDKTKSYFQPNNNNQFYSSQVYSQQNNSIQNNFNNSPLINQSDKYKSYYTEHQDYKASNVSQYDKSYNYKTNQQSQPRSSHFFQQNHNSASYTTFEPSRSQQRKRFYTVSQIQKTNNPFSTSQTNQMNYSNSMIFINNNARGSSISKQQTNSQKNLFKLVNPKLSPRGTQSQYNSRQKRPQNNSKNKSQYFQKANKKVSLKRDIAPISPKYAPSSHHFPPNPAWNKSMSQIQTNKKIQQTFVSRKSVVSQGTTNQLNDNTSQLQTNDKKQIKSDNVLVEQREKQNEIKLQKRISNSSSNSELEQNILGKNKQISFKKPIKNIITTYDAQKTKPSSQSSSNQEQNTNTQFNSTRQKFYGSIRPNNTIINNPISKIIPNQLIDPQVYTDMKISRIQQSTSNIQQKIQILTKTLQGLIYHSKQHQKSINQINQYITKQQQEGITPHDMKRINKELKIMKTNFQTAFTSMTQQINKKLFKEQNIMKSLSDQIKMVAQENQKLNQSLQIRAKKVDSLQKSMTSFMKQNQQRMESLVLNQSINSGKRSKNNSFQYGLDLKNMSGQQNYSPAKNQNIDKLSMKVDSIQRQIKKMKAFHIQQQQSYQNKFNQIKKDMQNLQLQQQRSLNSNRIQNMIQQIAGKICENSKQEWKVIQSQMDVKRQQNWRKEIQMIKTKLQQLNKVCHEQLYEYRMNKLQTIPNKYVTQSKIQSMNKSIQQQLNEVQQNYHSILITLNQYKQKFSIYEQKQHNINKLIQQNRIKQVKQSGNMRQLQQLIKQTNQQLSTISNSKTLTQNNIKQLYTLNNMNKTLCVSLQSRVNQIDRINNIQTENIQSINNQFQRVINKEIIPKFTELHHLNVDVNHRINGLNSQFNLFKKNKQNMFNNFEMQNNQSSKQIDLKQVQKKIQQYFSSTVQKFINQRVKLISTKLISSKTPLAKIGLFTNNKKLNQNISSQNNLFMNKYEQPQLIVGKQQTYLIDEDGYLMDWEGAYLMEIDQLGSRKKIKISQDQLYYMEVNGLQIKKTYSNSN